MSLRTLLATPATARRAALLLGGGAALTAIVLSGGEMGKIALRAAAVLGALALAGAWLRRRRGPPPAAAIAIEARQPLSRETGLALVRVGARRLLVGYGAHAVALVAEITEQEVLR